LRAPPSAPTFPNPDFRSAAASFSRKIEHRFVGAASVAVWAGRLGGCFQAANQADSVIGAG
jgi:hypothetical protein